MKILGIESTCDETAAAVVEDGFRLLSNVVHSQIDIHAQYGGVIPEVAARSHIEMIKPVIERALNDANCSWDAIDAIAVSYAPGLIGSLLVGTLAARTLAIIHEKPLYKIHHVEAHVYANFITEQSSALEPQLALPSAQPQFPMLALIVSGGHSQLVLFQDHGDYALLGQTDDDAVGEAFDKVAKIIGLPYPGGPSIEKAAKLGNPNAYVLPKIRLSCPTGCEHTLGAPGCRHYGFSFSGLKTAVLRTAQAAIGKDYTFPSHEIAALLTEQQKNDLAASFSKTAIATLVDATKRAYQDFAPKSVVIAGGVAASGPLRDELRARLPIAIEYAPMKLCTDNGAMIATRGYFAVLHEQPADPFDFEVQPSLSMMARFGA